MTPQNEIRGFSKDEIIEMAEKSGVAFSSDEYPDIWQTYMDVGKEELEAFAKLVAAKEREACAEICDSFQARNVGMQPAECAGAIRARGQE